MTDGIIQEVINLHNNNECKCKHACHNLLRIQQDIIEKIKQYELLCYRDNGQPTTYVPKVRLIGDNQE